MKGILDGKTIIVTGTSRGIGKKMVEMFAEQGSSVFALARSETEEHKRSCRDIEDRYGKEIRPIYFDLTD